MNSHRRRLATNRNFIWIVCSVGATILAEIMMFGGLLADIYARSGSALQTVLVSATIMLTGVIVSPFGGVLADRVPRKRLMAWANWGRALMVIILFWIVQAGMYQVWHGYVAAFFYMVGAMVRSPARMSFMPQIVERELLVLANSVVKTVFLGVGALTFWAVGVLSLNGGLEVIALVSAAAFVVGALCVWPLQIEDAPQATTDAAQESIWQSIVIGYRLLQQHKIARPLVLIEAMESAPQGIWTHGMLLVFIERALNGDSADWGLMNGLFQGALLTGTLITMMLSYWVNKYAGRVIIADTVVTALIAIPFALSQSIEMALVLYFCFGLPQAIRDSAQDSLLQATVDNEVLGRIYSLRSVGSQFVGLLSTLTFAWLADYVPIRPLFLTGALLFIVVALYAYSNVALRNSQIVDPDIEKELKESAGVPSQQPVAR